MNAKQKERANSLERRRRSARDWHLYKDALVLWLGQNTPDEYLQHFEFTISANGAGWGLLGVGIEAEQLDDPMLFASLQPIENEGFAAVSEANHRFRLAYESLKSYVRHGAKS